MKKNIAVISFVMICIVATLMVGAPQSDAAAAPLNSAALQTAVVPLNPDHIGATNPGFQTDTCPAPPAGQEGWFGWHFIMPENNNFTSLSVTFASAGTFSADPFPGTVFVAHPDNSHAYIWTPTADTLLAGSASSDGDNTFFNLSHVCPGSDPTNTPSPTNTSTPTDTPTNTPSPTNTSTPTDTPTNTPTDTPTNTPTDTPTNTPTNTPTKSVAQGQLKVCKVAGAGVPAGTVFTINVNGMLYNVPAGKDAGLCVLAGQYPLNSQLTIQEVLIPAGYYVSRIEVLPNGRLVSKNISQSVVVVKIGTGVTEVIFTNRGVGIPTPTPVVRPTRTPGAPTPTPAITGRLQVCKKDIPGVSVNFTFTFAGKTRTIPDGACTSLIVVPVGPLTITEQAQAGYVLRDIHTIPADRLINENLATRQATVTIVQGNASTQTIVVFTNEVATLR